MSAYQYRLYAILTIVYKHLFSSYFILLYIIIYRYILLSVIIPHNKYLISILFYTLDKIRSVKIWLFVVSSGGLSGKLLLSSVGAAHTYSI